VLAAGAGHSYFGHDEWETLAPGLKALEDALEIRRRILLAYEAAEREQDGAERGALLTFVVIGGAPPASSWRARSARSRARPSPGTFADRPDQGARPAARGRAAHPQPVPESLSRRAEEALRRIGVEVRTNAIRDAG